MQRGRSNTGKDWNVWREGVWEGGRGNRKENWRDCEFETILRLDEDGKILLMIALTKKSTNEGFYLYICK